MGTRRPSGTAEPKTANAAAVANTPMRAVKGGASYGGEGPGRPGAGGGAATLAEDALMAAMAAVMLATGGHI